MCCGGTVTVIVKLSRFQDYVFVSTAFEARYKIMIQDTRNADQAQSQVPESDEAPKTPWTCATHWNMVHADNMNAAFAGVLPFGAACTQCSSESSSSFSTSSPTSSSSSSSPSSSSSSFQSFWSPSCRLLSRLLSSSSSAPEGAQGGLEIPPCHGQVTSPHKWISSSSRQYRPTGRGDSRCTYTDQRR